MMDHQMQNYLAKLMLLSSVFATVHVKGSERVIVSLGLQRLDCERLLYRGTWTGSSAEAHRCIHGGPRAQI